MQSRDLSYNLHVCVHTGVLNYENQHVEYIGVWYTHVFGINFLCMLDFRVVTEVFTFLSVFDKRKCGYCWYCRLKVIYCLQS